MKYNIIKKQIIMATIVVFTLLASYGCGNKETQQEEVTPIPNETAQASPVIEVGLRGTLPTFTADSLDGQTITNDIFKDHKLTMINIWGTFCGPCIQEMPDLGQLAREMPAETQLIGIVGDIRGDQNLQLAKDILKEANADFVNLVPDEALMEYCSKVDGYPTTIFVDQDGKVVGEPLLGSRAAEDYRLVLEGHLNEQ